MSDDRSIERGARAWLELGPTQAPDHAVEAALRTIDMTSQERDLRIPWRLPTMNPLVRLAAIALVAIAAVGAAVYGFRPSSNVGSVQSPSPSAAIDAYRTAWNAICLESKTTSPPPNVNLWSPDKAYDPNLPPAERAKSIEVGRWIANHWEEAVNQLDAMTPPAEVATEHDQTIGQFRNVVALLRHEIDLLVQGQYSDARVVDDSMGAFDTQITVFQNKYGLRTCF